MEHACVNKIKIEEQVTWESKADEEEKVVVVVVVVLIVETVVVVVMIVGERGNETLRIHSDSLLFKWQEKSS